MKINKGDTLEEISLPKPDGSIFNLSETKGKKVLLTFYRIAGCSFCNLRLNELNKRFSEFGNNFTHVGIFHSPVDNLKSYMDKHGELPFTVLADENFEYFKKYEVEQSIWKFLIGSTVGFFKILRATAKGYFPMEINGMTIVPVDILINEKGIIEKVYYGKNTTDHLSFEEIRDFSLS